MPRLLSDLSLFASEAFPLRASALPALIQCPWRAVLMAAESFDDRSGKAADTGIAVHLAAKLFHKGDSIESALKAMGEASAIDFPLADLDDAERQLAYAGDPPQRRKRRSSSTKRKSRYRY